MPQIKEYRQQTNAPGPSNFSGVKGTDISGGAGNNLQAAAQMLGQVNDMFAKREMEQQNFEAQKASMKEAADINDYMQEIKMKAPAGAEGFAKSTQEELDKRRQTLLDEAPSEFIRERLNEDLTKIHLNAFKQAIDFEAESQAKKSKEDTSLLLDRAKNAVRKNPALIGATLEEQDKLIDAAPFIDQTTKLAWKNKERAELRQNEVRGWIDINPEKAKSMIEEGTWDKDLSPELKNTLLHESNQGIRALEIEAGRQKRLVDEVKTAKITATKDAFISKAAVGDLNATEVIKSDLPPADKEHMLRALKNDSLNVKNATDTDVYNDIFERINLPEGDPRKISNDQAIMAKLGNGLKVEDVQRLRKELSGSGSESGRQESQFKKGLDDIAKGMLTKSTGMGFKDPEGDEMLQRWRIFSAQEYEKGKVAGLSPIQMLDPASKDYIGRHLKTPAFQRTQEQILNSITRKMQPPAGNVPAPEKVMPVVPVAPRAANESPADYLKRTKAQK